MCNVRLSWDGRLVFIYAARIHEDKDRSTRRGSALFDLRDAVHWLTRCLLISVGGGAPAPRAATGNSTKRDFLVLSKACDLLKTPMGNVE